jgi:hypothetical protein
LRKLAPAPPYNGPRLQHDGDDRTCSERRSLQWLVIAPHSKTPSQQRIDLVRKRGLLYIESHAPIPTACPQWCLTATRHAYASDTFRFLLYILVTQRLILFHFCQSHRQRRTSDTYSGVHLLSLSLCYLLAFAVLFLYVWAFCFSLIAPPGFLSTLVHARIRKSGLSRYDRIWHARYTVDEVDRVEKHMVYAPQGL